MPWVLSTVTVDGSSHRGPEPSNELRPNWMVEISIVLLKKMRISLFNRAVPAWG